MVAVGVSRAIVLNFITAYSSSGLPVRFVLWKVANGAPSVVEVVARPSAVRHSVHDLVAHPGVYHGLLKDPHGIAVAEMVWVLGLIAIDVEIAYAHCDELQAMPLGVGIAHVFAE